MRRENYTSAIMSQNGRNMAKILHNAAKKFDWVGPKVINDGNFDVLVAKLFT